MAMEKYKGYSWDNWQKTYDALSGEQKKILGDYTKQQMGVDTPDDKSVLRNLANATATDVDSSTSLTWDEMKEGASQYVSPEQKDTNELNSLIDTENLGFDKLINDTKTSLSQRRAELARLLNQSANDTFNYEAPSIQEDLSAKGLLHSSGLGEAYGREKSRLAQLAQQALSGQSLADTDTLNKLSESKLTGENTLRTAGLERKYSNEDLQKQMALMLKMAQMQTDANNQNSKNQLLNTLIQGGFTLGAAAI